VIIPAQQVVGKSKIALRRGINPTPPKSFSVNKEGLERCIVLK
jgi:hypothetical protein